MVHNGAPSNRSRSGQIAAACADAGLTRRITPHMLRHTAATLLIETGVDIRIVQRLLGHSRIATTEIYTHGSDEALRTTLQRADVLATFAPGPPRGSLNGACREFQRFRAWFAFGDLVA
jgi:site-specific recombinase XerD